METLIVLKDLRLYAYHGALPSEHKVGSSYLLTLEVDTDFSEAMRTDHLAGTVNYAAIYEVVKREMQTPSQLPRHPFASVNPAERESACGGAGKRRHGRHSQRFTRRNAPNVS